MRTSEATLEQLNEAIATMESHSREPQKVSEVLPLVVAVLREKATDIEQTQRKQKFYAPIWVGWLTGLLWSGNGARLSNHDYIVFRDMVERLSVRDYKPADDGLEDYEVQYTTLEHIAGTVTALKRYFKLA